MEAAATRTKAFARDGGGEIFRETFKGHVIAAKHSFESPGPSEKQDTEDFGREVAMLTK